MDAKFFKFPDGFFWGAATSSHQVEGGTDNDWSEWEKSPARISELKKQGRDPRDFISGSACDHYNRYSADFDMAKELGHNMHRLSLEWSRIEPEEGKFNQNALQHYKEVLTALRGRGIEPMVTLWHFTTPRWLAVKGGVLNPSFPELYKRFISATVDNLKGEVRYWVTFNEATNVYAGLSYLSGQWPPQGSSILKWLKCRKNIAKAHTLAYREIKNIYKNATQTATQGSSTITSHNIGEVFVGSVENINFLAVHPWLKAIGLDRFIYNSVYCRFWRLTLPYQDFLGLNYYTVKRLPFSRLAKQPVAEEMGWEIYPEGLREILKDIKHFKKPVFITENGIADRSDRLRESFIRGHLESIARAISDGADVRGYLYWSLLDNFEWARGFGPRFGLAEIDYKTLTRTIRPSAYAYARIIRDNGLEVSGA